jgi:hypothetical protein
MKRGKRTIFFSNPKVSRTALLAPHLQKTVNRIKSSDADYILAIQDGMVLNYSSHKAKTEIGRIGRTGKIDQYGLIQHSTLCVSNKNEPLGLIDLQYFHNDDFDSRISSDRRSIEDKKTICWINALNAMRSRLGECEKEIITVADREGDFFEFLHALKEGNESFVIRSQHDRCTGELYQTGGKFSELFEKENELGTITISINDVKTHEIKETQLKVKSLKEVEIPVPRWPGNQRRDKNYKPIRVNVVKAYNESYCWILLTNFAVDELSDCQRILTIYKERWHIEDYHKILKTGYQVDELYLHTSLQAIENALTMACISACRLYWMIYIGRVEDTIKADSLFKEYEWKCLYVYFKEPVPTEAPRLSEVILRIAKLGGYKLQKGAKPPGIKTMWLGFQSFSVAAEMYQTTMSTKT